MLLIEWVILISASLAILSVIMFFIFFASFLRRKGQLKKILESKPKRRRDQRKWRRAIKDLEKNKQNNRKGLVLFCVLMTISIITGGYTKYYQMTNMTTMDTDNIVSGYYLLDQIQEQFVTVSQGEGDEEQLATNIYTLAIRMASFSAKKGSDRGSEESQLLLNRYYARMGQFGVNLSSQDYKNLASQPEVMKNYLEVSLTVIPMAPINIKASVS